ncbi:MAG: creatininase family protein [Clostridia bacterium]|nr:creatininase family protein [Clostridia bacterium]
MNNSIKMELSYPREVERVKKEQLPVLLPIGTMEYHSTHCPYGCDTLVAQGICEKVAEQVEAMILPPVWYGVASYAVGGPETNTLNVDCDTMENYVYCILKSLFDSGFKKNIFIIIAHQTEDYMPMTLACMKAAKKLIMSDLEKTSGYGWWGKRENKNFYSNLSESDGPWNRIRIVRVPYTKSSKGLGDHAGIYECSMLENLYPGSIKLERLGEADDWFAETAMDMNEELGKEMVDIAVNDIIAMIKE